MTRNTALRVGAVAVAVSLAACSDNPAAPTGLDVIEAPATLSVYPAPTPLASLDGYSFYAYTSDNYYAVPKDPVNLIFTGNTDPRALRAALLALDGDRSGLSDIDPLLEPLEAFTCEWRDALGRDEQVAFGGDGWTASVVQLACGDYGPVRVHLRLFPAGGYTVANAHFEVMIPNTADHQVLSWELAENLVLADFLRTGMAAPVGQAAAINDAPTFRSVPAVIFNELPAELQVIVAGAAGDISEPAVGIPTDGNATIIGLFGSPTLVPGTDVQQITLPYDIVAPKPICNSDGTKFIHIGGAVDMWQADILTADGQYSREFRASGQLQVTPIDPATGQPSGPTQTATISQLHLAKFWPGMANVTSRFTQILVPVASDEGGRASVYLEFGPNGKTKFAASERCGS